jgi:hypothetical protein
MLSKPDRLAHSVIAMMKNVKKICDTCPHELILGVACDWKPEDCCFHAETVNSTPGMKSHKHSAWAVNVAEEWEYDAVKSFG